MSAPIEVKVSAAAIASAVSGLGLWALQTYAFHGEVPLPVLAAVQTVVPAVVTFAAGWLAPHTPRPADCGPLDRDAATGGLVPLDPEDEVTLDDATPSGRHVLDDDPDDVPARNYMTQNEIARRADRKI